MKIIHHAHKIIAICLVSFLTASLLPSLTLLWAEAASNLNETDPQMDLRMPPVQQEESVNRPPSDFSDLIVQVGEGATDITPQSDNSGVETIPGAAFVHTNEFDSGTEAEDWFFSFADGFLTNDSGGNPVCLMAPVYLPIGSRITSFTAFVRDSSPTTDVAIFLDRTASFGGWTELSAIQSSGSDGLLKAIIDPSVVSGANLVEPEFNYHVSMCLPPNSDFDVLVYGAQVRYVPFGAPEPLTVYLPFLLKAEPPPIPLSFVYITNLSGGLVDYTILNTPQGNINCKVPNGAVDFFCDRSFPMGTYNWKAQLHCGSLGPKPRQFTEGVNKPSAFRCD